jgi:hypothetical protein
MKIHKTATQRTPELSPSALTAQKSTGKVTESSHPMVQLKAVPANGHIVQERGRKVYSILKGESNE